MLRAYWGLKYDRNATAKLYELRDAGFAIHDAIKALKFQSEPWIGALAVSERPRRYEFESHGGWVGFEKSTDAENVEPTLKILYVVETTE
jgi:hypothetical protein